MKRIIASVSNDLFSDSRVDKVCNSLVAMGYEVILVGRQYRCSPPLSPRRYKTQRLSLCFKRGIAFYAEFNLRLFLYLLFHPCDILVANDLDTLLPNFLVSKLLKRRIVYDSHEYFCGVPELSHRPHVRRVWHAIERFCFPKLPDVITVCQSIADLYDQEYPRNNKVQVVRNVPYRQCPPHTLDRHALGLPLDKKIIIMQGAINIDRGAEELIDAMRFIDNALLLIIGQGDVIPQLKVRVREKNLTEKVRFIGRIPFHELYNYTCAADVGCSLEKDTNINYRYCLPNKLFDYMRAGIPVVVSNLPEMAIVVQQHQMGLIIESHKPEDIAQCLNKLLNDKNLYLSCQENSRNASQHYCWEQEEEVLRKIYLQ